MARRRGTDPTQGLTAAEASARLERWGANELQSAEPIPAWRRALAEFRGPLIYLLLAAVVVSLGGWTAEGAHGVRWDAVVTLATLRSSPATCSCSARGMP